MVNAFSIRCWRRLQVAIEGLPDSDRKQFELDHIQRIIDRQLDKARI